MSRTRPEKDIEDFQVIFGAGFEVSENVKDCYLKKIAVKEKEYNGQPFYRVVMSFLKDSLWVNKVFDLRPKNYYASQKDYDSARLDAMMHFENIMACYMHVGQVMYIKKNNKGSSFLRFAEAVIKELEERGYKDVPVTLKTVPSKNGGVDVARYTPFMNRQEGPQGWLLSYDTHESKLYREFLNNKNK